MSDARIAVLEAKLENMREDLSEIKADLKTLINERHEGIGKKSMFLTIAAVIGGFVSQIIDFFRQ